MLANEILEITCQVTQVLENLNIPYLVGGSLASSLHGIPRATQDPETVDIAPISCQDPPCPQSLSP